MSGLIDDSIFWVTAIGLIVTFLTAMTNACLRSKCKRCSVCCGALVIDRDVKLESQEIKEDIQNHIDPYAIERIV